MEAQTRKRLDDYLKALGALFMDVKSWTEESGLTVQESPIEMDERTPGKYEASKLTIFDRDGKALAEVKPVGAWIIGADGRADIVGHLESHVLTYWAAGAPEIDTAEAGPEGKRGARLFDGAETEGWYWIEDKIRGRARRLDKEVFLDLTWEVQPL